MSRAPASPEHEMNPQPALLTALLPCSQVKNQDFFDCLPEAVSWRKPDQWHVKSCHPGEHSTQQLGEETQK